MSHLQIRSLFLKTQFITIVTAATMIGTTHFVWSDDHCRQHPLIERLMQDLGNEDWNIRVAAQEKLKRLAHQVPPSLYHQVVELLQIHPARTDLEVADQLDKQIFYLRQRYEIIPEKIRSGGFHRDLSGRTFGTLPVEEFGMPSSPQHKLNNALYSAVDQGDDTTAEILLELGADINGSTVFIEKRDDRDDKIHTHPILLAAIHRDSSAVEFVLSHGGDANMSFSSSHSNNPFLPRTEEDPFLKENFLLETISNYFSGYASNETKKWNRIKGMKIITALIDHGADINRHGGDFRQQDRISTPLAEAAELGEVELVRLLLSKGADPWIMPRDNDRRPLSWEEFLGVNRFSTDPLQIERRKKRLEILTLIKGQF